MEKLVWRKGTGMAAALRKWLDAPKEKELTPSDLVGLLVDAEWHQREEKKLTARLRNARFRQQACVEDIDYQHQRGLAKAIMLDLAACRWVTAHQNVIFTGETGVGKSYLACALGQKACREGYAVVYRRASRLLDEMAQARADGTHLHLLRRLAKCEVLVIDERKLDFSSSSWSTTSIRRRLRWPSFRQRWASIPSTTCSSRTIFYGPAPRPASPPATDTAIPACSSSSISYSNSNTQAGLRSVQP